MGNVIIHTEPGHLYITPVGFLDYAKNYHSAAINWKLGETYSPVPFFLYSRSIELGFKSFILAKGKKLKTVKDKIGHNLISALDMAIVCNIDEFFSTSTEEREDLKKANAYYSKKEFEYFDIKNLFGKNDLPNLLILRNYSERLLNSITEFVLKSA